MTGLIIARVLSLGITNPVQTNYYVYNYDYIISETLESYKIYQENPKNYSILFRGFDYDSEETEIVNMWYEYTTGDIDMITTFFGESNFNHMIIGGLGEKGYCQLMNNDTNRGRLEDPRRTDKQRQAKTCMEKWLAVPEENKGKIWMAYWSRGIFNNKITYLEKRK